MAMRNMYRGVGQLYDKEQWELVEVGKWTVVGSNIRIKGVASKCLVEFGRLYVWVVGR